MNAAAKGTRTNVRSLPRRIPTPASEPRYDDERAEPPYPPPPTQGALALELTAPPSTVPDEGPADARRLHVVAEAQSSTEETEDRFFAPQPTPRSVLPDPKAWSGRYVQALVEILGGERPAAQLMRWTAEGVYADITRRVRALSRASRTRPGPARPKEGSTIRARVQSVHVCEPHDGIVEAAVHVRHGGRSRAVAVRFEGWDGRWRCTALRLG